MIVYGPACETTGLSPVDHELVAIAVADGEGTVTAIPRWEHDDEPELLVAFLEAWDDIERKRSSGGALFVGVNHLTFDVPFLLGRCSRLESDLAAREWPFERCWDVLVRWPVYFDLAQLVGGDLVGLQRLRAALLDEPVDDGGRDVPVLYRNERYDAIDDHLRERLATIRRTHLAIRGTDLYRELIKMRRRLGAARDLS